MKLIYLVIDGLSDLPIKELGNKTPLEAANTPNMDFLANHGKTGLMYPVGKGIAPESDVAVMSILGYDPFKYSTGRGVLEALGSEMEMKDGDLALRCNFATVDAEQNLIDRRVGRTLTTEEAQRLSQAINEEVKLNSYPADFEFKSTLGHRAVLVIRGRDKSLSSKITNIDPAYSIEGKLGIAKTEFETKLKKCEPLEKTEEAKIAATLVNEFVEKSHKILEEHEINKKREKEGKLKANIILTRDAGHLLPKFFKINEKYGVKFASLADMPVEKGISKLAGMHVVEIPPPSRSLWKDCEVRVEKLLETLPFHDGFYVHIKGPDEPAHDGNFNKKKQLIETIDQAFLGKLLQKITMENHVVCITADHSTPCKLKAHSDDPVPVLISGNHVEYDGVEKFSERECAKGSLGVLTHGTELLPRLIQFLKMKP